MAEYEYDRALNSKAIRFLQLEQAMVAVRQNAAGFGLGASILQQSLRGERDEIVDQIRESGSTLLEDNIQTHKQQRATRAA